MEALERADQELKEAANFRKNNPNKERMPNPMMLGMEPSLYMLWVLKSVKHAELEQSLLVLPLGHVERLLYYLVLLLKAGRGVELCSRVSVFLVKTHQNQVRIQNGLKSRTEASNATQAITVVTTLYPSFRARACLQSLVCCTHFPILTLCHF